MILGYLILYVYVRQELEQKAAVAERMRICTPRFSRREPMKPNALLSHEPLLNSYDLKFLCV